VGDGGTAVGSRTVGITGAFVGIVVGIVVGTIEGARARRVGAGCVMSGVGSAISVGNRSTFLVYVTAAAFVFLI